MHLRLHLRPRARATRRAWSIHASVQMIAALPYLTARARHQAGIRFPSPRADVSQAGTCALGGGPPDVEGLRGQVGGAQLQSQRMQMTTAVPELTDRQAGTASLSPHAGQHSCNEICAVGGWPPDMYPTSADDRSPVTPQSQHKTLTGRHLNCYPTC